MGIFNELDLAIQDYVQHLANDYAKNGYNNKDFYYEIGRKYVHIIMQDTGENTFKQRSSHSWVMINDDKKFKQGEILKSASWNAPARNFGRGNVLTGEFKNIRWCGV
jgi:hypothetical protein